MMTDTQRHLLSIPYNPRNSCLFGERRPQPMSLHLSEDEFNDILRASPMTDEETNSSYTLRLIASALIGLGYLSRDV